MNCGEFKNYYCLFTDGSKEGNRVAAAVVHRDNTKCVKTDAAAKSALSPSVTPMKLPATDMYSHVRKLIFDEWQEIWYCCAANKLHAIKPTVGYYKQKTCL